MNPSDKISVQSAAAESGMSVAWWRKEIRLKRVAYYKLGGRILISRRDIQAMLNAERVEPAHGELGKAPSPTPTGSEQRP